MTNLSIVPDPGRENFELGNTALNEGPPSQQLIIDTFREGKVHFEKFYGQCKKMDDYYYLRNTVAAPKNHDPINPPTIRAIIDDITAHIDTNNLAIDVPEASTRAKARAEKLKKFYLGHWLQVPSRIRKAIVKDSVAYGIGWGKFMYESELWPDAPREADFGIEGIGGNTILIDEDGYKEAIEDWLDKRSISYPIRTFHIKPQNMMWDDSRTGIKWNIEFYGDHDTTTNVNRMFPQWTNPKNRKGKDGVDWMEYWDDTWVAYLADDQILYGPHKHGYGFNPYKPLIPGTTLYMEDGKPEERFQGEAWPGLDIFDAKARFITMFQAIIRQFAWPGFDFKGPEQQARKTMDAYEPFGKNLVAPNVEVEITKTAQPPQEILGMLSILETELDSVTVPSVVRGQRPSGVSAGFPISVLAGLGRLNLQPYADGAAEFMSAGNVCAAKLVENKIRDKITVHVRSEVHNFDQTIEPKDIRGYYENSVTLKAEAPEEREREALLAMRLYQSLPWFTGEEALKRAGVDNPLEMMIARRAEDMLLTPEFMQQQVQGLLGRLAGGLAQQQGQAASPLPSGNTGNQFLPGQQQLQRPGETNIQQARVASQQGRPSVFPQGQGGIDLLGSLLGTAPGGAQGVPSGQTVR